jgi:pSer/pThr/pTyr-binding forkhead associated (FHA) protein
VKVSLELLDSTESDRIWPVLHGTTRIGRAPDNHLVITEPSVSGHHLVVSNDADGVKVRDLGSTNGTFLNEQRLDTVRPLKDGDLLRIGLHIRARVRVAPAETPRDVPDGWLVHQNTGRSFPVRGAVVLEQLLADLTSSELSALDASPDDSTGTDLSHTVLYGPDAITLSKGDKTRTHGYGQVFSIGPHRFIGVGVDDIGRSTVTAPDARWTLQVDIAGRAGAQARVIDPEGRVQGHIRASNRVAVLHQLVVQFQADQNEDAPEADRGWMPDEDLMSGVWGRHWRNKGPASFQVLVHRVRKDLGRLGLAGAMIEKRSGHTRLRPGRVQLVCDDR